ncbi:hypothetical protein BSKO_10482 [Bryopsis sp. KO-2023]|nr:hypothetical protein BSKO_10482 [Bryopsis sp. KO-2023]
MQVVSRSVLGSGRDLLRHVAVARVSGSSRGVSRSLTRVRCEGDRKTETQAPTPNQTPPQPGRMPSVMPGPDGEPIKVVPLEKAGSKAWAGVAAIDDGKDDTPQWLRTGTLVAGDALGLLVFAAIGKINHGEILDLDTIGTALPFMIGWFSSAALLSGYGPGASGNGVGPAAATAGKCWIVGTPIGLGVRSAFLGYPAPTPFAIVSMVATGVIMVGWRSGYGYFTTKSNDEKAKGGNKKGGPFAFFRLLFNLTQRW